MSIGIFVFHWRCFSRNTYRLPLPTASEKWSCVFVVTKRSYDRVRSSAAIKNISVTEF